MHSAPIRKLSWALVAEVPILLVTLGLLAWALHILAQSIMIVDQPYAYAYNFPADQTYLYTVTQTVTGYRTSSVAPPSVVSHGATSYSYIGTDSRTSPYYVNSATTYTLEPVTYGIDPTGTKTRVETVSGFQEISHLALNEGKPAPSPTPTPAPTYSLQPRQEDQSSSSTSLPHLYASNFWNLPSTTNPFVQYESVSVNRGFHGNFLEVGVDYIYKTRSTGKELPRIRALTTLVVLALVCIIGRLACTAALFFTGRSRRDTKEKHTFIILDGDSSSINRKLAWSNIAFALLLLLTYIPFWAIYASWTYRSAAVKEADAAFQSDQNNNFLSLNNILHTEPWTGAPIPLIVFWTLSTVTSILTSIACLLAGRESTKSTLVV